MSLFLCSALRCSALLCSALLCSLAVLLLLLLSHGAKFKQPPKRTKDNGQRTSAASHDTNKQRRASANSTKL
jgi:hypothetical protein